MEIPALADLLDVQDLDLQIDRLLAQRAGLPELAEYRRTQEQLDELAERYEVAAAELRQVELDTDKADGELDILEAKLTEHETRLFAGGMSGRETEHMRLEVQSLHGQKSASEERVLGLLERLDAARQIVADLTSQRESLENAKSGLEAVITEKWRTIDGELARKEERKTEALAPVPDDLVGLYEKLRETKEGVAVGRLEDGTCGGCHMRLSPAEQIQVRESDPPRCVHCRRILVP